MKKILLVLACQAGCFCSFAQPVADSNFVTIITAVNWMPDGKELLLNIVKFDKTRKVPPVFGGFTYTLASKKLTPLGFDGGGRAASPDGKTLVFVKQKENKKGDIYLYDLIAKKETPLVTDTFNKVSPGWSADGKKIVYNRESNGRGRDATLEICVIDISTKEITQVTESGKYKSYNPVWAPVGNQIVYYFEKGDSRDQVWLTDSKGSFHTNLTNDTSTHNFYPSWIDKNTIVYTLAPDNVMTMRTDGTDKKKVEGIHSFLVRYNPATGQAAYVTQQPDSKLILYDWKKKTSVVLLQPADLKGLL
jgi:dipeptidyl aminopeptidase/acylaminoacyl peptidase